jgi:hypothetical protein
MLTSFAGIVRKHYPRGRRFLEGGPFQSTLMVKKIDGSQNGFRNSPLHLRTTHQTSKSEVRVVTLTGMSG